MEILESALRLSVPLAFAALGGVLSERVGVVNIALEGMLLSGAFAAMAAAHGFQCGWLGVAAAALCGALLGLLHALLVLRLRVDAIISGVGINLLAAGATTFLLRSAFSSGGVGVQVSGPAPWLPSLRNVPVLGLLLGGVTPLVPLAVLCCAAAWFVLYRTRPGLQLRAVGEAPAAARAAGIPVNAYRALWLAAGGALAGVGGAYLSLVSSGRFTENLSAGRGFLALAAVILGRWHPLGAVTAVLLFGLSEALQFRLQGQPVLGVTLPSELWSALPYLLGLLALAGFLGRSRPPAGLGQVEA
ncbi:MAG: ABC transporter permease [Armatimonadota bacterium]